MTTADDIFARPPRFARPVARPRLVGRVACVACGLRADVLLCKECAADPAATKARILREIDAVLAQGDAALDTWLAFAAEHADDWDRVQAARKLPDFAERAERHRAKGNIYGCLIDAEERCAQALAALGEERARLGRALESLGEI